MRLVFDIENDGFLEHTSVVHCICAIDIESGDEYSFSPDHLDEALALLNKAQELAGHNILNHDLPVLQKVLGWRPPEGCTIRDTMLLGFLCFSDLEKDDYSSPRSEVRALAGGQSLEAWGVRLGARKAVYTEGWDKFTPGMLKYCLQDTRTNLKLYHYLRENAQPAEAEDLEHRFAVIAEEMSRYGFPFDIAACEKLTETLNMAATALKQQVNGLIKPEQEEMKTAAYWEVIWPDGQQERVGTKTEAETLRKARKLKPAQVSIKRGPNRVKVHEFNPGSRKQIREHLLGKYGWISPKLTEKGQEVLKQGGACHETLALEYGSVDEDTLRALKYPEAEIFADYLLTTKIRGQAATGPMAWLKLVHDDGRIRHRLLTIGCATHRCAHSSPNIGQVPSIEIDKETGGVLWGLEGRFGADCRSCFTASEGHTLVGTDLSGIEARMLAHFLHHYDGGAYVDQVLNGDIHQLNCEAFQSSAGYVIGRGASKPIFYGWLYGAGNEKLGLITVGVSEEAEAECRVCLEQLQDQLSHDRAAKCACLAVYGTSTRPVLTGDEKQERKYNSLKIQLQRGLPPQEQVRVAHEIIGGKIRQSFESGITGLGNLIRDVQKAAEKGYLTPLDGRRIPVRKAHSALNTLLQGSAAIVAKQWVVRTFETTQERSIPAHLMAFVHDEIQTDVKEGHEEEFTEVTLNAIKESGEHYGINIPLAGESRSGRTWADTH